MALASDKKEAVYDWVRRRRHAAVLGSAMEEDEPPFEPMAPEELSPFVRKPVAHVEPPMPETAQVPPDILGGLDEAQQADALARQRAGFTNASKKAASAISGFTYKPDYVTPEAGNESAYLNRRKSVADYLLRKQRGDAYAEQVRRLNQPKPAAERPLSAPPVVDVKDKSELEDAQIDVMRARADALRKPKGDKTARKAAAQAELAAKQYRIPGYDWTGEVMPPLPNVQKLREAKAQVGTIDDTINEIVSMYERFGGKALPDTEKGRLGGLITNLRLMLKGPAGYELGVLAGPDLDLLKETAPDGVGVEAAMQSLWKNMSDERIARYRATQNVLKGKLDATARAMGYRTAGSKAVVSDGRRVFEIDEEDLPAAERDGFRRVR